MLMPKKLTPYCFESEPSIFHAGLGSSEQVSIIKERRFSYLVLYTSSSCFALSENLTLSFCCGFSDAYPPFASGIESAYGM